MTHDVQRLALTSGEPAGIGPELCLQLDADYPVELVVLGNRQLFEQRCSELGIQRNFPGYKPGEPAQAGHISLLDIPMSAACTSGQLDPLNADYVLTMLRRATQGCLDNEFSALVTAPLHKGVINDAGFPFTGHTEFLAELCDDANDTSITPVMMLATEGLRVALATTHIPLQKVAEHITTNTLRTVLTILDHDLKTRFGIEAPRIHVCGLNPHAGENGHLGTEEQTILCPLLEELRAQGMDLTGPLPADTVFTPTNLVKADAVLAMYHDQGLPVLKHMGFGNAVNITLGLPIIRTSVDHGTALQLAGTGKADRGSLDTAISTAIEMIHAQSIPID